MIIQGYVETDKGPVEISKLAVGDNVLDEMHRPRKVLAIETKTVKGGYKFQKNPDLILAKKTILKTLYGEVALTGRKAGNIFMQLSTSRDIKDTVNCVGGEWTAYNVQIEGASSIYVSHYCVKVGD